MNSLAMRIIMDGTRCTGFLLPRGITGVEAFNADARSLGLYKTEDEAAAAVSPSEGRG
jgi:hypothetical protein